ncbi:MAG: PDZ domain-containing protein [Lachnospiraceae bacterium]
MNQVTRTKVRAEDAGALGLVSVDVSEEARQIDNIPTGAFVYELTEGSAAEKAGIREGENIVKLDKTGISSKSELLDGMQYYAAGETVAVTVKRSGSDGYEEKVVEVELGKKSDLPGYQNSTKDDSDTQDSEEETEGSDNSQDGEGYQDWYDFGGRGQILLSDGNGDLGIVPLLWILNSKCHGKNPWHSLNYACIKNRCMLVLLIMGSVCVN